jgi:small-conductance mechanosensitive channel
MMGMPLQGPDCGRYLRQSQPRLFLGEIFRMFEFRDLFQWDRFITPTIIKTFYWLVIGVICLFGLSGIFAGLTAMAISPFAGFLVVLESIAGVVVGIVFSRIAAELILIVFRINEHLGAIRDQGGGVQ